MELLLIKKPHTISFAGNPVTFTLGVMPYGAPEKENIYQIIVRIEVEDDLNSGIFIDVKESAFYPDDSGIATIDIRSILKSFLTTYIPPLTQTIPLPVSGMIKRYRLSYRLLKDNNLVNDTVGVSAIFYVMHGGISLQEWHPKKYFTEVIVNQKPFLRFSSGREYVFADEKKYLSWIYPFADEKMQYIKYTLGLSDGSEITEEDLTGISDEIIYDENTEWATSSNAPGANFNAATLPYSGAKHISFSLRLASHYLKFLSPAQINPDNYEFLKFYIKISSNKDDVIVSMYNNNTPVAPGVLASSFGLNLTNYTDWQLVEIPVKSLSANSASFNIVRIDMLRNVLIGSILFDKFILSVPLGEKKLPGIQWQTYITPAGFKQLGLDKYVPTGKMPLWYSLQVVNKDNVGICNPQKFYLDYRNFYDSRDLLFVNSLGGIETLRLRGEVEAGAEYSRISAERVSTSEYFSQQIIEGINEDIFNSELETFKGDTGFTTKDNLDRLRDLFITKTAYEIKNNRLIPVNIIIKNAKFFSNRQNLYSVAFDWQHAFSNENYTPAGTIGISNTCPAVENFIVRQTGIKTLTIAWALETGYKKMQVDLIIADTSTTHILEGNHGQQRIEFDNPASPTTASVFVLYAITDNGDGTITIDFTLDYSGPGNVSIDYRIKGTTLFENSPASFITVPAELYEVRLRQYDTNYNNVITPVFTVENTITEALTFSVGGTANITVSGRTICNDLADPVEVGPATSVNLTVVGKLRPAAITDYFRIYADTIASANIERTFPVSVLANDFDKNGSPMAVIPATGTTPRGGVYSIDAEGIVTFTPNFNSGITGDYFDYTLTQTDDEPLTDTATVFISLVMASAPNSTPIVYVKCTIRDIIKSTSGQHELVYLGQVWLEFYSDAAATAKMDVTGMGLTINVKKTTTGRYAEVTSTNYTAVGYEMIIFNGRISIKTINNNRYASNSVWDIQQGVGYKGI